MNGAGAPPARDLSQFDRSCCTASKAFSADEDASSSAVSKLRFPPLLLPPSPDPPPDAQAVSATARNTVENDAGRIDDSSPGD